MGEPTAPRDEAEPPKKTDLLQNKPNEVNGKAGVLTRTGLRMPPAHAPALVVTQAIDAPAQAEWAEDLNVMDKLLRDEIVRVGGEDAARAMGIKLTAFGRAAPMYVEDCGAVFSFAVNWPLAAASNGAGGNEHKPRDLASGWERAKRELNGYEQPNRLDVDALPPPVYDAAQLEDLIVSVLRVLPEATNFRHLKDTEFVFVTVAGFDDGGAPRRLTIKAKKADVDDASAAKLTPDEFRQRVAIRIG